MQTLYCTRTENVMTINKSGCASTCLVLGHFYHIHLNVHKGCGHLTLTQVQCQQKLIIRCVLEHHQFINVDQYFIFQIHFNKHTKLRISSGETLL